MTTYSRFLRWFLISLALHGLALAAFQWLPEPEPAAITAVPGQSAPVLRLQTGFIAAAESAPRPEPARAAAPPLVTGQGREALLEEEPTAEVAETPAPTTEPKEEAVETSEPVPAAKTDTDASAKAAKSEVKPEPERAPLPEAAAAPIPNAAPRPAPASAPLVQPETEGERTRTTVKIRRAPLPPYPQAALRAGLSDVITLLEVAIDARGRVSDARILKSCGRADMDRSALNTVRRVWRFQPAKQFGKAVPSRETVEIYWKIR